MILRLLCIWLVFYSLLPSLMHGTMSLKHLQGFTGHLSFSKFVFINRDLNICLEKFYLPQRTNSFLVSYYCLSIGYDTFPQSGYEAEHSHLSSTKHTNACHSTSTNIQGVMLWHRIKYRVSLNFIHYIRNKLHGKVFLWRRLYFLVIREMLHFLLNLMIYNSAYKSSSLKQIPHFPLSLL
jgi:hypothetical protein